MSSGFLKTFALAIVLTLVLIVVVNVIGDFAVRPKPGYSPGQMSEKAAMPEQPAAATPAPAIQADAAPAPEDLSSLLASADPAAGQKYFRRCKGCHSTAEGARNLVGPNLWDVVGRTKGSVEGYKYSQVVGGLGGDWTYEDLDAFLSDPRTYAKGTKMAFKGIKKAADRAMVIGYLRSLSDAPKPLP